MHRILFGFITLPVFVITDVGVIRETALRV